MIQVSLYRDDQCLLEASAQQVVLPGAGGEISVFSFHAPMLCALAAGTVLVDERRFPIRGGFAKVANNKIRIFAS